MNYQRNKALAVTINNEPTMTDQTGARDTDINVIVANYTVHGQAPGTADEAMYEDFSELPTDLRGFLELAESLEHHKGNLPKQLQQMNLETLLGLTHEQLTQILKPADNPADKTKDDNA